MIVRIILYCIVSITLIYILHQFYDMLRDNLTNTKVIDLVHSPNVQYGKIYNTLYDKNKKEDLKNYFDELTNHVENKSNDANEQYIKQSSETILSNQIEERFDKQNEQNEHTNTESIPFQFTKSDLKYDSL